MLTVYSDDHRGHVMKGELSGGCFVPPFEKPERADLVLARVREMDLGPVEPPAPFDRAAALRVHDEGFVRFLETCWDEWSASAHEGDAMASMWPARRMRHIVPDEIEAKLGYYASTAESSIVEGTWKAAMASAACALTGQRRIAAGERAVFALCRPPGHHAAIDMFGGYCFLNNAAIAAQAFLDDGADRVAILDIDFHHGNGTQDIFYRRGDVLLASLHGEPRHAFPHYLGYADETGEGEGEGCNLNYPMARGTAWASWSESLEDACRQIAAYGAEALVVSLGVDAFKDDPISFFRLESEDFTRCGARIAKLGLPTLFALEGGYAIDAIGVNAVNVLTGYEAD
jgi:acetoin utilization deacetylase AcuC-like enzyme